MEQWFKIKKQRNLGKEKVEGDKITPFKDDSQLQTKKCCSDRY
jgi:hypothetical protein